MTETHVASSSFSTLDRSPRIMDSHDPHLPDECNGVDAARELGISTSTFNSRRRRIAQYFDATAGRLAPIECFEALDARQVRTIEMQHVCVAPPLGGLKMPGTDWSYSRRMLKLYLELGLAGVAPHAREWTRNTLDMLGLGIGTGRTAEKQRKGPVG